METKLLPCSFCGSDNCWTHEVWNRHTDHAQGYYVECYDCGAMKGAMIYHNGTWDGFYKTEAEAIEAWNTRHERTCDGCKYPEQQHISAFQPGFQCIFPKLF